jgi:hypothetical protein
MKIFKDIYEELSYKFKYLPELKPDNIKQRYFGFSDFIIDENFVHDVSPERYTFYLDFQKALKDPEELKDIIYEYKLIKNDKREENKIVGDIVDKLNQLSVITDPRILNDESTYIAKKDQLRKNEMTEITNRLKNTIGQEMSSDGNVMNDKINKILNTTFTDKQDGGQYDVNDNDEVNVYKKYQDILKYLQKPEEKTSGVFPGYSKKQYNANIDKIQSKFENQSILHEYRNKLHDAYKDESVDNKVRAQKLKDIISDIENNNLTSIHQLNLSKEDKLVFIAITFIIRQIVLWLLDWSLTTNFVVNFTNAFMLYIVIYTLLLLLIMAIVNITYNLPIINLYTDKHSLFSNIGSTLYYFYLIPGNEFNDSYRIIFHLGLMYFIVSVAFLVKEKDKVNNDSLSYDYTEKKKIIRVIGDFTLIIWTFTSILAMYMI